MVADINANAVGITSIWSDHTYRAWIHDDKGKEHYVDGDGILLFRKTPDKLDEILIQGKAIIGTVFEIGSTAGPEGQYWIAVVPEVATEWYGFHKNLGKPCARKIPISPDLVMEVLGVNDINTNLLEPPVPTLRFNSDRCVYMLTFSVQMANHWAIQKEVWYDRDTKLPTNVLLFDKNGRIQLRAYLSDYQVLEGTTDKRIATKYNLFFPETRDSLVLSLKYPKLTKKGLPREGTIARRPIGDVREVRIDEDCP